MLIADLISVQAAPPEELSAMLMTGDATESTSVHPAVRSWPKDGLATVSADDEAAAEIAWLGDCCKENAIYVVTVNTVAGGDGINEVVTVGFTPAALTAAAAGAGPTVIVGASPTALAAAVGVGIPPSGV